MLSNYGRQIIKEVYEYFNDDKLMAFVAPYEADPQLAYMFYAGMTDIVVSSDSDMLLYGVPIAAFWDSE